MKLLAPLLSLCPLALAVLDGESPLMVTDAPMPSHDDIIAAGDAGVTVGPGITVFDAWPNNPSSEDPAHATDGGIRICFDYASVATASTDYRDTYCVASWSFKDWNNDPVDSSWWTTTGWSVGSEMPMMSMPSINLQYPVGGLFKGDNREGGITTTNIMEQMVINTASTAHSFSAMFECFSVIGTGVVGGEHVHKVGMVSPFPSAVDSIEGANGQLNVNGTWTDIFMQFPSPFPTAMVFSDDTYITTNYDPSTGAASVTSNSGWGAPYENVDFHMTCDGMCPMSCAVDISVLCDGMSYTSSVAGGHPTFTEA